MCSQWKYIMDRLNAWLSSETDRLTHVVLGLPDTFHISEPEVVNETQHRYYFTENHPKKENLQREFEMLRKILENQGIAVYQPKAVEAVPDQLTPRDIGFVIGDTFVLSNMKNHSRWAEWRGIEYILRQLDTPVIQVPEEIMIEGGDVVIHDGFIYVGISERTSRGAADFLARKFPDFEVIPIPLRNRRSGHEILHLDCAFMPVGNQKALFYPEGFEEVPPAISCRYDLIEVTDEEQTELAVNVLSLSPQTVVSRRSAARVNALLRDAGLEIIELDFDEAPKTGGSFRCCTLPLRRG